ncbi:MAG: TIGR03905 family TSCPD domain-containing protein [Bacilli bacterium]
MEKIEFTPTGVCSKKMIVEIENGIIKSYRSIGGCPGNSLGINALVRDMTVDDAISRLSGIKCGLKKTSCPNELSKALVEYKEKIHS